MLAWNEENPQTWLNTSRTIPPLMIVPCQYSVPPRLDSLDFHAFFSRWGSSQALNHFLSIFTASSVSAGLSLETFILLYNTSWHQFQAASLFRVPFREPFLSRCSVSPVSRYFYYLLISVHRCSSSRLKSKESEKKNLFTQGYKF